MLDNECNKKRDPESLLEFVMSPHFSALSFVIPEEIINGEDDQPAAWVRGICTLHCFFFPSFCSAKDYFNPSSWPNWHDSQVSMWGLCNYVERSKKIYIKEKNGLFFLHATFHMKMKRSMQSFAAD